MNTVPAKSRRYHKILKISRFDTKLGQMIAIADDEVLYLLEFADKHNLERGIKKLELETSATIIPGSTDPAESIAFELKAYFEGTLSDFKTPLHFFGTSFQKLAWKKLTRIPYARTQTYKDQANAIGEPAAYRAVANANAANRLAIVIPCHRVITCNGSLGGYSGGITRKQWLIDHEKHNAIRFLNNI